MGYFPASYSQSRTVTKSDTVNFDLNLNGGLCDALYIGGAGVVVVVYQDGSTAAFTCIAGQILPVRAKRVNSTNTTANDALMQALYSI